MMRKRTVLTFTLALLLAAAGHVLAASGWGSDGTKKLTMAVDGRVIMEVTPAYSGTTPYHPVFQTRNDNAQLRFNSRDYTQASGSTIAGQAKPSQTITTTGDVIGWEFSPRVSDAGAGALIALRADPVIKDATSARTVSAVRGLEINIDFPGSGSAYTITNDVSAIRVFPDFGSGHTFSGVKAVLEMAAPNTSNFDYFIESESGNATWIVAPGNTTALTNMGYIRIRHAGTTYRVPVLEDE